MIRINKIRINVLVIFLNLAEAISFFNYET